MQLPEDFIRYTRAMMGEERFEQYLQAFNGDAPVSIRLNPLKTAAMTVAEGEPVPWCQEGYYLPRRPQFTMDPLLHAGCYYVQEAASMFVSHVLRQYVSRPVSMLDLCAAPGGKSTAAIASLPAGSVLFSNEPVRQRASILLENITKWGYPDSTVTNNYPRDYRASKLRFDVILCDVPCSGEGMFRKDQATIGEWSLQNVERCAALQYQIVRDAWTCLNPGGLLIYSTCTFNTKENEENIQLILNELEDCYVLPVDTQPAWNITSSLLDGFTEPVYRFVPGITKSEGLFLCVLCKGEPTLNGQNKSVKEIPILSKTGKIRLNLLSPPKSPPTTVETSLNYQQAMAYLRGEALMLPSDTPRGTVSVTFDGHVLGTVKNIGSRANNQYPKEWRIKTTHIPTDYETILRHT